MSFSNFTNLDFNSLRSQIKDYLRANSNFTDFDFEGSNFSVLIDVLAYNSYITAFNTNMAVNEAFIDSATLRENVVSLARNIGYIPRSRRASRAKISFSVSAGLSSRSVTLKSGIVALGAAQGGSFVFSIPEDITVSTDNNGIANFSSINIYEGTYLKKSYVVNKSTPDQRFIIPNGGADTTTVRVFVSGVTVEEFEQYQNLFRATSNTKFFLIQEIKDEKYEIIFGDDIIGKKPISGSTVNISYIVTNGSEGNGAANFTFSGILEDNNGNTITSGISAIFTDQSSENGDDIEPIESVKYLAPRIYSSQYRAVTANDYIGLVPFLFPNIESVSAYGGDEVNPPEYGKVFVVAKPRNGSFLSQASKIEILNQLRQYSVSGIKVELKDLKYLYIELDSTVYYDKSSTSNINQLRSSVINTLTKYAKSSELNGFGGRFKYSKLMSLIDNTRSSITSNITKVKIRRNLQPEINKLATYELCYGNQFHVKKVTNNFGFNIKSSGFQIDQVDGEVFLSDVPIDDTFGKIFFFKFDGTTITVVTPNAGTVNYKKGEIIIDPVIITGTSKPQIIEVQAVPESNDVVGLRDLYLELSLSNTMVNMLEDTIATGEDTSASSYIITSSYVNGNFTR
jgi:hypothetical protein